MPAPDYACPRFRRPLLFEDMGFHGGPRGGGYARTDVLREAPPVFVSGWLAHQLQPLGPLARGSAAMALSVFGPVAALWARRAARRRVP